MIKALVMILTNWFIWKVRYCSSNL